MGGEKQEPRIKVKIKLSSQDSVNSVLRNSRKLQGFEKFEALFIAPDRSIEERATHKKFVEDMTKKIRLNHDHLKYPY